MVQYQAGPWLLQGADASTACLNCHGTGDTTSSYHVSTQSVTAGGATIPAQYTPGGDFSWIKQTTNSVGSRRGHNIVAVGYDYVQDSRITQAPGGTYSAAVLGCTGCHNPHGTTRQTVSGYETSSLGTAVDPIIASGSYGQTPIAGEAVGAYRLLGGAGYVPKAFPSVSFANNPPVAVAPGTYNKTETGLVGASNQVRVAYGAGMSEWCANCHSGIHLTAAYTSGTSGLRHPAGNNAALGAIADNYNAYISSGNLTGGQSTSFLSLVPFEEQTTVIADLLALASTSAGAPVAGPSATSTVSCVSCHRAHASGWSSMIRYDISDALITDELGAFEIRGDTAGATTAQIQAAYYGRTNTDFAPAQRILCNKCHAKD